MKKMILTLAVLSAVVFAGPVLTPEVKSLLKVAKSKVDSVSAAELKKMIKDDSVVILDIRDPNEWKKGTIKADKLVQISRGFLEIKYPKLVLKKYTKNDNFVVFCTIEPRAILASSRLKELGFKNVRYLKGGFRNWKKNNF